MRLPRTPNQGDLPQLLELAREVVTSSAGAATTLTPDHVLHAETRGRDKVLVTMSNMRNNGPGIGFEFRLGSRQVNIGTYDPDTERFVGGTRVVINQKTLDRKTAEYVGKLHI